MASDQTYEKVLTAADIDDRINIPAAVRDGLFWDVAENSKTDVRMVDEKGDSHDVVLTVRKNRTKPAFMAKGSSDFVKKRKLFPGDVLLFSRYNSPRCVKVKVQERAPRPASTLPAFGSDHPPIKPPAAAPVALGLGGLSNGFDHGLVEPPEAVPQAVELSLSMARFSPCNSLGIIKAEVEEEGPKLQVAPFSQDESTPERPVALSMSLTCNVMPPPTPVQGPTADLRFLAKAGDPELLFLGSPATHPWAAFNAMAPSAGHGFSAKAGCHELRRPKPPTALVHASPAARSAGLYFSGFGSHELLEPKARPPTALVPGGAPVVRSAAEHVAGLCFPEARCDELPVGMALQAVVNPQVVMDKAGLGSFSTTLEMLKKPQPPAELVAVIDFLTESGHVLPEPTPPAAVLDQMAAPVVGQPSTNMLQEPPKKHLQDEQAPAYIKLFGVFMSVGLK